MKEVADLNWTEWMTEAKKAEAYAFELDKKAHSFPIGLKLFLEASGIARKSAGYYQLAAKRTNDPLRRSIALANYHISIGNCYKSLGNFFYYSEKPARAAKFLERAAAQFALSDSYTSPNLREYSNLIRDSTAHQTLLQALVADCYGKDAKLRSDWVGALKHFSEEKEILQRLEALEGDYAQSINKNALIKSTEREIQVCYLMLSFINRDFTQALEHAESALAAAEKAFQEEPDWFGYQKALKSAISLRESLKSFSSLFKHLGIAEVLKDNFEHLLSENESHLDNLASYKFEREVESYLRRELQYTHSLCRYKPPYLGRQIDIFAFKGDQRTTITICECKLRFNKKPINSKEIERFSKIANTVRKHEGEKAAKEGRKVTTYAWLVTNADSAEEGAVAIAKKNKVEIKHAEIPKGRERLIRDTSWQVSGINDLQ
jgi:hypothetical protein